MRTPLAFGLSSLVILAMLAQIGHTFKTDEAQKIGSSVATQQLIGSLDGDQKKATLHAVDSPQQVDWHFIPMNKRKGLELNRMTATQRATTHQLLQSLLSQAGYDKTTQIMDLERLLKELQNKNGGKGPIRDNLRYYLTLFGTPSDARWGVSFEGHHLSLNFVLEGDKLVSSSPQFFATNPAIVKAESGTGIDLGTRVLRLEETLAFELVNTLSKLQLTEAVLSEKAPREIRAAGEPQPPNTKAEGISWKDLSKVQRQLLRRLMNEYVKVAPEAAAKQRSADIKSHGLGKIHFAWAGPLVAGVGHYYRVQGPTFLIEFVNTQPDADGNPANHIHCVWRDMRGDFAKPIGPAK